MTATPRQKPFCNKYYRSYYRIKGSILPLLTDFDQIAAQLEQEADQLWTKYRQAKPEQKAALREQYLAAMHRLAAHVSPPKPEDS
jgi:hypothetical protein